MARAFAVGEKVLILDSKKRRYLATLSEGGQFHSHSGVLEHNDIVGSQHSHLEHEACHALEVHYF